MRRRLQTTRQNTDCTDRYAFGRRNRYALAAQTVTGTSAVDNNPASKAPESGNGGPFLFHSENHRIYNTTIRSRTEKQRSQSGRPATQSGAAEFRAAVHGSVSRSITTNLGTPATNKSVHKDLKIYHGRSFLFPSNNHRIYNTIIRSRAEKSGANYDASAALNCAAEFHAADRSLFRYARHTLLGGRLYRAVGSSCIFASR